MLKMFGRQSDKGGMNRRPSGRGDTWAAGGIAGQDGHDGRSKLRLPDRSR
jgi:hypothetical protein